MKTVSSKLQGEHKTLVNQSTEKFKLEIFKQVFSAT